MDISSYIRAARVAEPYKDNNFRSLAVAAGKETENKIDINALPETVMTGGTLLDVSTIEDPQVRAGLSLALLFANRVAHQDTNVRDAEDWLAAYQGSLAKLGFRMNGTSFVQSAFRKRGVNVHKAIIPFLTAALGGGGLGATMIALLENLDQVAEDSPWITLYDAETRRFSVQELHFAAAAQPGFEMEIAYAIARFDVEMDQTQFLFFKVSDANANFESMTTRLRCNTSLLAVLEDPLRQKLMAQILPYIWEAKV